MKQIFSIGLIVLALAAVACTNSPASPPATVSAAETSSQPSHAAQPPSSSPPQAAEFLASGPIIVEDQVDVAAQRDGVVAKVTAEPGTPVKKGQLLAALDDRQISADLEAARAKTRSTEDDLKNWQAEAKVLEADYARAEKLWEAQIIPKEQLDHARYKAESDEWDVKRVSELLTNAKQNEQSLQLELEKTRITAPFDGVVARRYVRVGQSVAKNDRLFWVTAVAPLRIRVTLPERFLGRIRPGVMVGVTSSENPAAGNYRARVIEVSPVVDPASDTIEVLAELTGNTSGLRPGMRADLHVADVAVADKTEVAGR
ncbi:MAG TPA: efflux RND transporter periplasmic adaptor subunit [Terriglobales bacterium]